MPEPNALVLIAGHCLALVKPGESKKVTLGDWVVGTVSVRPNGSECVVNVNMATDLIFPDGKVASGWTGEENNIAVRCELYPGHTFRLRHVDILSREVFGGEPIELRFGVTPSAS